MIMITIQQSNMASWRTLLKRRLTNGNILYKRGIFQKKHLITRGYPCEFYGDRKTVQ